MRVFVSSTLAELADERQAVARAIAALRLTPVMFESGARPEPPRDVYRAYVAQSDMTLQALREKVGDDTFFSILRTWYADHRGGDVTTSDFTALAEQVSGQDLDHFFQAWLYEEGRPTSW